MKTAVIIPSYNGLEHLKKNLDKIVALKTDQIIIIDDASTDSSCDYIQKNYPEIKLIINNKNIRFPAAVNRAFTYTDAQIVFLLNQDVSPEPDLVEKTLPLFKDKSIFAVTFNEGHMGLAQVDFTKGFINYISKNPKVVSESFWASGGSSAIRKNYWDKLQGFDEIYSPGYLEDLDLSWRARRLGLKILWSPESKVYHQRETTFKKTFKPDYLLKIKERNYLIVQWKNLNTKNLISHVFYLILRCIKHPGFIKPVIMAISKLPRIIKFRYTFKSIVDDDLIL